MCIKGRSLSGEAADGIILWTNGNSGPFNFSYDSWVCLCPVGSGTLEDDVCESPDVVEFEGVRMDGGFWLSTLRGAADVNTVSKRTRSAIV